jgi:hypothetical protein
MSFGLSQCGMDRRFQKKQHVSTNQGIQYFMSLCELYIRGTERDRSKMGKRKRKQTSAEKAAKRKRRLEYETIFINGKMKRVRRAPMIDGMPVDEFIRRNADPIWLHQNEMWEYIKEEK